MADSQSPQRLTVGSGQEQRSIAYLTQPGNPPGVFWMQGFKSEMTSMKATALAKRMTKHSRAYTRFDYSGHGQSDGNFEDGTISRWLDESAAVFERTTTGPQIVVGSSMGGYLALLLARRYQAAKGKVPSRIAGLVLIAPAWDMTEELIWKRASDDIRRQITEAGVWYRPSQYDDGPYAITRGLIEDGRHNLLGTEPWRLGCPVEIIHGRLDQDVPFTHSERLVSILQGSRATLTEVLDGEHRLSRPQDLVLLFDRIDVLANMQRLF